MVSINKPPKKEEEVIRMAKPSIRAFKARDKDFTRCLSHAGHLSREQALEMGMNPSRIHTYQAENYIERTYVYNKSLKMQEECYFLTEKGRRLASDMMGIDSFYRSNGATHDVQLARIYGELSLEQQRSWITEKELRGVFQEKMDDLRVQGQDKLAMTLEKQLKEGRMSPGDGAYLAEDGTIVVIEIITDNYGKAEIQAKEEFVKAIGGQIEISRA